VDEQEALIYLCKNFKYEKFEAGKVIFEEGDLSNGKIYIILTGEVLIVKKTVDYYTLKNIEAW
jgi:CRP-like cAMP-binding protein